MEITFLYIALVTAVFFTYLAFSRNTYQTMAIPIIAMFLWIFLGLNSFSVEYVGYDVDGNATLTTVNGEAGQTVSGITYVMVGLAVGILSYFMFVNQIIKLG